MLLSLLNENIEISIQGLALEGWIGLKNSKLLFSEEEEEEKPVDLENL